MALAKNILSTVKVLVKDPLLTLSLLKNIFFFAFKKNIVIVSLTEHIGDIVAAEPISRYVKEENPEATILWIVNKRYRELVNNNPSISRVRTVTCFTEWILLKRFTRHLTLYDLHISGKFCQKHGWKLINPNEEGITVDNYFHKGNLLYCLSRTAGLKINNETAPVIYSGSSKTVVTPVIKTVVIHTSSNIREKNWTTHCWDELVKDVINIYTPDKITEVGFLSKITIQYPSLERSCGRQSLRLITDMIHDCSLFIGVESGFAHIANALEKQSIILAGKLPSFEKYMPYSGKFMKEAAGTILFLNKPLPEISYEEVKESFLALLKNKL